MDGWYGIAKWQSAGIATLDIFNPKDPKRKKRRTICCRTLYNILFNQRCFSRMASLQIMRDSSLAWRLRIDSLLVFFDCSGLYIICPVSSYIYVCLLQKQKNIITKCVSILDLSWIGCIMKDESNIVVYLCDAYCLFHSMFILNNLPLHYIETILTLRRGILYKIHEVQKVALEYQCYHILLVFWVIFFQKIDYHFLIIRFFWKVV